MKDPKKLTEVTVEDIRRQQEELEDARRRWPEQLRGELLADGHDQEQTDRMVNFFTGAADDPGDSLVDWCDATLDADHWAGLDAVGPTDAAMLLCNLNPGDESVETAKLAASHFIDGNGDPGHIDGDDFKKLQRLFEVASQCDPRRRTLADWLGVAKDKGAKHHPWVGRYLSAAAQQLPTPAPASDTATADAGDGIEATHKRRERRLAWVRERGADHDGTKMTGKRGVLAELARSEAAAGHPMSGEKEIRGDLKAAVRRERESLKAGHKGNCAFNQ